MLSRSSSLRYCVSQTDLTHIMALLARVTELELPLHLSALLEPSKCQNSTFPLCITADLCQASSSTSSSPADGPPTGKVQLLQQPKLNVGRGGLVQQMLPSAIRFWEKEGLGPRNGTKDVVAFALFEGEEQAPLIESWLERVGRAYSVGFLRFYLHLLLMDD